jgi:hypothetical protein
LAVQLLDEPPPPPADEELHWTSVININTGSVRARFITTE